MENKKRRHRSIHNDIQWWRCTWIGQCLRCSTTHTNLIHKRTPNFRIKQTRNKKKYAQKTETAKIWSAPRILAFKMFYFLFLWYSYLIRNPQEIRTAYDKSDFQLMPPQALWKPQMPSNTGCGFIPCPSVRRKNILLYVNRPGSTGL